MLKVAPSEEPLRVGAMSWRSPAVQTSATAGDAGLPRAAPDRHLGQGFHAFGGVRAAALPGRIASSGQVFDKFVLFFRHLQTFKRKSWARDREEIPQGTKSGGRKP